MNVEALPAWSEPLLVAAQIIFILLLAWLALRLVSRGLIRLSRRYPLPPELFLPISNGLRWLILGSATILVLERLGVSGSVLWSALTGFIAVGVVAFFAVWSVLSNVFCAVLIMVMGPFRLGDQVEVVEAADKPGMKGRVISINLLYTTLRENPDDDGPDGALLQVPNSLFFQRAVRRWRGPSI